MNKRLLTVALGDPGTLAPFLAARLSLLPAQALEWVARGAVFVDGRRCLTPDQALAAGARVTLRTDPSSPPPPIPVVYRDDWLLIVDKPAGLTSQATRAGSEEALDARVRQLAPESRLLHRLDREASGLVLFAARLDSCAPLQAALASGRIDRRYLAVVAGRLEGEGDIELRIARHARDARLRVALPKNAPGGQSAETHYRALGHAGEVTAVELTLETGRTHQLRVHLSAIGHPIVGDRAYGGFPAERLCLHAHRLAVPHPREARVLNAESAAPEALTSRVPALTRAPP